MKNLRLSVKLIGGFLIVSAIVLGVGFAGWNGVSTLLTASDKMSHSEGVAKQLLQREIDHLNWARKVGEFQRNENLTELGVEKDEHNCGFGKWYYGAERKKAEAEMPEISGALKRIEDPHRALHNSAKELEKLLKKGKEFRKEATAYYATETSNNLREVQKILEEVIPTVAKHADESQKAAHAQGSQVKKIVLVGMIIGTLVALALGIFLSFSITKPINRVVEGLTSAAEQVASASSQVASAGQSLAEGASEQAAGLEETSSSIEEMTSMTKQNADNAGQANNLMKEANQSVEEAKEAMTHLTRSMEDINRASEETSKIIKTIDEIAFQTNLLALNAAVEAARAGEAGAGFAVVADEVRNLAMRAAEAAKNTANLIDGTVKKVKEGAELVTKTGTVFSDVVQRTSKVGGLVGEITAASQEQAQGIDQISKAVAEMDKVVQQNAANAEESAAAAEQMSAQSEEMRGYVNELAALVGGKNGARAEGRERILPHPVQEPKKSAKLSSDNGESKLGKGKKTLPPLHSKEVNPDRVIPMGQDFKDF